MSRHLNQARGFGLHLPLGANVIQGTPRGDHHADRPFWSDGIIDGIFMPHPAYDIAINLWIQCFRIVRGNDGNPAAETYFRSDRRFLRLCRDVLAWQRQQGRFLGGGFPHHINAFTRRLISNPWAREQFRRFVRHMFYVMMGPPAPLHPRPPVPMS